MIRHTQYELGDLGEAYVRIEFDNEQEGPVITKVFLMADSESVEITAMCNDEMIGSLTDEVDGWLDDQERRA